MSDILSEATKRLADAGIESPRREARILLAHILGVSANALLVAPPQVVTPEARERFMALVERRAAREPLAYITGKREFWSLPFAVGRGVLIPRPDTETLIEQLLASFPDHEAQLSILDLGTGSACLLAAALQEYPRAQGVGVDVSLDALRYAAENLAHNALDDRAELVEGDFRTVQDRRFDVVLSNPPYIPAADIAGLEPDVRDYEPLAALDGGPDGLDAYRALAELLPGILAPGGVALLEIGQGQEETVPELMRGAELEVKAVTADLAGISRCVTVQLRS